MKIRGGKVISIVIDGKTYPIEDFGDKTFLKDLVEAVEKNEQRREEREAYGTKYGTMLELHE